LWKKINQKKVIVATLRRQEGRGGWGILGGVFYRGKIMLGLVVILGKKHETSIGEVTGKRYEI